MRAQCTPEQVSDHVTNPERPALTGQQKRLRWKATLAAMSLDAIPGLYVGSSPLVDFMNDTVPAGVSAWLAPGVTQPAVFIVFALCFFFPLYAHLLRKKKITVKTMGLLSVLGTAFPLSIAVTAGGGGFWVQYAGAAVGGAGLMAAQFVEKIVAIQWWALTGDAAKGAALLGCSVGVWSVAFTLLSADLCQRLGLENAMYFLAAVIFAASLFPLWLAGSGELQAPEPAEMPVPSQPLGGGVDFRVRDLLRSLSFWQLLFHFTAFFLFGFGQKALLSPIFQATYNVTYVQSARFAAAVIAIYAAVRGVLPLVTRRLPLLAVNVGLLAFSAVLYACFPAIVGSLPVCWLVAAKTLTGASFAGQSTLRNLLVLEVYGAADLANVLPLLEAGVGVGKSLGPLIGYYTYLADQEAGEGSHAAYNPFFYACAAVAAADAINMMVLYSRTRR